MNNELRKLLERLRDAHVSIAGPEFWGAWKELRALLAKPAVQHQGEPVAWANGEQLLLCSRSPREVQPNNPMMHNLPRNIAGSALRTEYCDTPLYAAQPHGEHPA